MKQFQQTVRQINKTSFKMSKIANKSRMVLPNISSVPSLSYAQRYEHMTKLANYNQMNEGQIWKEYQKLRTCLKQINEQVLYHMERKASTNIINQKSNKPINKDSEGTLMLLEDQKKTNQLRYSNFYNELSKLEERLNYLSVKNNYLEQMTIQIEDLTSKIKNTQTDIKDCKRKAKIVGKNIVNCTSVLDKLIQEQTRLNRAYVRHRRFKDYLQNLQSKQSMYKQRILQTQQAFQGRIKQFSSQQNFIEEEIHFERYEELKRQKQNMSKYESVYKRNYLMKLRDLENIINSISRHDKVIQENEDNIVDLRSDIQVVSSLMGKANHKKRSTSSMLQMSLNSARQSSKQNNSRGMVDASIDIRDVNEQTTARKRVSSVNDKNQNQNAQK